MSNFFGGPGTDPADELRITNNEVDVLQLQKDVLTIDAEPWAEDGGKNNDGVYGATGIEFTTSLGKIWKTNAETTSSDVPGTSPKWEIHTTTSTTKVNTTTTLGKVDTQIKQETSGITTNFDPSPYNEQKITISNFSGADNTLDGNGKLIAGNKPPSNATEIIHDGEILSFKFDSTDNEWLSA